MSCDPLHTQLHIPGLGNLYPHGPNHFRPPRLEESPDADDGYVPAPAPRVFSPDQLKRWVALQLSEDPACKSVGPSALADLLARHNILLRPDRVLCYKILEQLRSEGALYITGTVLHATNTANNQPSIPAAKQPCEWTSPST
jgi:hypothetical protein